MTAAPATVPCVVCRRDLEAPPQGGTVVCPQCGEANVLAASGQAAGPRCPNCGEPVAVDAPACPACGELLGPLTDDLDSAAPRSPRSGAADATLGAIVKDAARDLARHWWLLGLSALAAELLWIMLFVSQVLLGVGGVYLGGALDGWRGEGAVWGFFLGYGIGALAALPVNAAAPLGLANLHLAAVRRVLPRGGRSGEGSRFAPLWRARGRRRMLLCGGLVLLAFGGQAVAALFVMDAVESDLRRATGSYDVVQTCWIAAIALPALIAWLLFWPLPFLIVDRPHLRHVRPLKACLHLPRGHWGGYVAIGLVSAVALVAGGLPALVGLPEIGLWLCPLTLPVTGPMAGLLIAHVYDRLAHSGADREEPAPLDLEVG
ncbi:zinc ribbon domain-containing protein [Alienimonas sp. DA493]|uniref:zinc ribbon domain-containing protein n=1 Tax=Alienimonas sp. DA493 TaxID=3373605 RepID=UPI0037548587